MAASKRVKKYANPLASFQFRLCHALLKRMPEWRYRGRTVTAEEIDFIRRLITDHPTASRRRLSEKLLRRLAMEAGQRRSTRYGLPWLITDARSRRADRVARDSFPTSQSLARRERPQAMLIDTTPLNGAARRTSARSSLQQVRKTVDEPLFNSTGVWSNIIILVMSSRWVST